MNLREAYCDRDCCYSGCQKSTPVEGGCHEGDLNKAKGLDVEDAQRNKETQGAKSRSHEKKALADR